jgi:hypothetical protein
MHFFVLRLWHATLDLLVNVTTRQKQNLVVRTPLTFDLVGGCGPDLCLAVLEQTLEGWHQVVLGDLWTHSLLQLLTKIKASSFYSLSDDEQTRKG